MVGLLMGARAHGWQVCGVHTALRAASALNLEAAHRAAAGPAKKRVRWSDEQDAQQEPGGSKDAGGSGKEGRSIRRRRKAEPTGKAAGAVGMAQAAAAAGPSKENVALPAQPPDAQPAGKKAPASKMRGGPGSGSTGAAGSRGGDHGKLKAGKGRAKALLRRMRKSL